jgi:hypothetical protein
MPSPDQEDYIQFRFQLLEEFEQSQDTKNKKGSPFRHKNAARIVFFSLMMPQTSFRRQGDAAWVGAPQEEGHSNRV